MNAGPITQLTPLFPAAAPAGAPEAAMPTSSPATTSVARRDLLAVDLATEKAVGSVRVQEVTLGAGQPVPLHLHPCPVVGVIRSGAIAFQIVGQPVQHLRAGDAFHEPAGVRVARFDAEGDEPATFVAFYLLGPGERETIRLIER
jgi:quercetin dioxygenase-like cupin family protein